VIPDKVAPIIPYATIYQGDCLPPTKKESLLEFLDVILPINIRIEKYVNKIKTISIGDNISQRKKNS
tara:strand:- start:334 stop:534 length:201 start_codon:yes stop_codon:yes gene_type:complete